MESLEAIVFLHQLPQTVVAQPAEIAPLVLPVAQAVAQVLLAEQVALEPQIRATMVALDQHQVYTLVAAVVEPEVMAETDQALNQGLAAQVLLLALQDQA
jgi:hypothetical protein